MSKATKTETIIVGVLMNGEETAFVPEKEAIRLARIQTAFTTAKTWGEFKSLVEPQEYAEVVEMWQSDDDEEEPDADGAFDTNTIGAFADGDYPPRPQAAMLEWMPSDVRKMGEVVATTLNGDYLTFPPASLEKVIAALGRHGYTCRRDDDLVAKATGWY